jgi:acylglycerol lipase
MPIMLYGHSLGGNIVLHFLLKKRKFIIGAVASSPWLTLAFEPPFYKVLIGRIVGLFWPEYSDSNKTSLEADVILDKNADPLLHDKISITTYLDCKKAGKRILQKATALSPPILLMHGTKDQRTSWTSTAKLGSRLSHPLSKFISFKGAGHELHEFKKRLEVYNTVSEWMKNVLKNQ